MFALKYVIELGMKGSKTMDKDAWTKKMLHAFCELCIKAIDMGMAPHTYFNKVCWKFLLTSFEEQTKHSFTKAQLKAQLKKI